MLQLNQIDELEMNNNWKMLYLDIVLPIKSTTNYVEQIHLIKNVKIKHFSQVPGHQTMEFFEMCAALITQLARWTIEYRKPKKSNIENRKPKNRKNEIYKKSKYLKVWNEHRVHRRKQHGIPVEINLNFLLFWIDLLFLDWAILLIVILWEIYCRNYQLI